MGNKSLLNLYTLSNIYITMSNLRLLIGVWATISLSIMTSCMSKTEKELVGHWSGTFSYDISTDGDEYNCSVLNTITFAKNRTFVDEYSINIRNYYICLFSIKGDWEASEDEIVMKYDLKSFKMIDKNDEIKESIIKSIRNEFLNDFKLAITGTGILLLSEDELVLSDLVRDNPTYKRVEDYSELKKETSVPAQNSVKETLVETIPDGNYYFEGVVGNVETRMKFSASEVVVDSRVEGQCQYASPADKIFILSGTIGNGDVDIYEFYGSENMSNNTGAFHGKLYRLEDGSLVMRGSFDCIEDGETTRVLQYELKGNRYFN